MLLALHVFGGSLGIVAGGFALAAPKGSLPHRIGGLLFVYAMIVMGLSGSVLALVDGLYINVIGGLTAVYFVVTALQAFRPPVGPALRLAMATTVTGAAVAATEIGLAAVTMSKGHFAFKGVPVAMLIFLAVITVGAVAGDIRVFRRGSAGSRQRLRRHLWRMCFALFIASGSFFSIRARVAHVLPEALLGGAVRTIPILAPFIAMFYWLWRPWPLARPRRAAPARN